MAAKTITERLKEGMGMLVIGATVAGSVAGTLTGKTFQQRIDRTEISSYQRENEELKKHLNHHEEGHGALKEFLLDLRSHLAADTEIENLFKASASHVDTGIDMGGPPADMASVQCCKEEARRLDQLFRERKDNDDPRVRAIGDWLDKRCLDHLAMRRTR